MLAQLRWRPGVGSGVKTCLTSLAIALILNSAGGAGDGPLQRVGEPERNAAGLDRRVSGGELAESLSEDDRAKLRRAVQEVWGSAAVKEKRDELHRATQAFRAALKDAIDGQEDPGVRQVMTKLLAERYLAETKVSRATLRSSPAVSDVPAADQLRDGSNGARARMALSEEEQSILMAAREAAMEATEVASVVKEREAATGHAAKMAAARRFRLAMRKAMLEADPRMAAVFAKLERRQR